MRRQFLWAVPLATAATPALAHEGDHTHMALTQAAQHLASQPDHQLAFAGLVAAVVTGGWAWVLATARK
jgi:hypothetical protein